MNIQMRQGEIPAHLRQFFKPSGPPRLKAKDLCGIPWRFALAMQAAGWWLRGDYVWSKPNPMPESVTDRCTRSHEYIFHFSKAATYFWDSDSIREAHAAAHLQQQLSPNTNRDGKQFDKQGLHDYVNPAGRNARSVWEIATEAFSAANLFSAQEIVDLGKADYVGADGKPYKRSLDCPAHAAQADTPSPQTDGYDARLDRPSPGNPDSDGRPVFGRGPALSATALNSSGNRSAGNGRSPNPQSNGDYRMPSLWPLLGDDLDGADESRPHTDHTLVLPMPQDGDSDSPPPPYAEIATGHSIQSHRTGHGPVTNPACSASVQTNAHTDGIPESHARIDSAAHIDASSSAVDSSPDEQDSGPSGQTTGRSVGKCTCSIITLDHFATFPSELVRRCISAGSSERGACAACGAPYKRVSDRIAGDTEAADRPKHLQSDKSTLSLSGHNGAGWTERGSKRVEQGWAPTCTCDCPETRPCVVLDPFSGSGTSLAVARQLGRIGWGAELNPDYCDMAIKRLRQHVLF